MKWNVRFTSRAKKQKDRLPVKVQMILHDLAREIESLGPVRGNWPNYSKLADNRHHCHLKRGKPTFVAVWREVNNEIRLIEVIYAGTHEKAPY